MPFAPVNGINLYYEVHGSGPPVVLAHGTGGNHLSWWQQVPVFARHYTCITFDHRAFGRSLDVNSGGRSFFGPDLVGLLDHLGIDKATVVAHSMGGRTALALALRATERCRALVLGGSAGVGDAAVEVRRQEAAAVRGDRGLGAFSVAPSFKTDQPELYHLLRAISRMNPPRSRDFLRLPPPRGLPNPPVHERLIGSEMPVFIIVGEHDLITPPDMIEMCNRLVPGSRFDVVPGAGHSAYFENPSYYNEAVLRFLREVVYPEEGARYD